MAADWHIRRRWTTRWPRPRSRQDLQSLRHVVRKHQARREVARSEHRNENPAPGAEPISRNSTRARTPISSAHLTKPMPHGRIRGGLLKLLAHAPCRAELAIGAIRCGPDRA